MSAVSFRSVFMVASCAGAALGCYLVSLRVASERSALEDVETQIVLAQRDIRVLQTEIGTRGRLAQLERWNVKVMALSAPTADQFLKGGFELARFTTPEQKPAIDAPVVLASAPAPERPSAATPAPASRAPLLHEASLKTAPRENAQVSLEPRPSQPAAAATKLAGPASKPAKGKLAPKASAEKPAARSVDASKATAPSPTRSEASVKPSTQAEAKRKNAGPQKSTTAKSLAGDPLAPQPNARTQMASAAKSNSKPSRESTSKR